MAAAIGLADHVGDKDGGEAAFHAQSPSGRSLAAWAGGIYRSCAGAECRLLAVVSTGGRNTLIFGQRWSAGYEVPSSDLLLSRAAG